MRGDGDQKVEDVLLELDGLPIHPHSTASQLLGSCKKMNVVLERPEHHCRRSHTSHLRLEYSLCSSHSRFFNWIARFVDSVIVDHHARLTSVVSSALGSLELDPSSFKELKRTAE